MPFGNVKSTLRILSMATCLNTNFIFLTMIIFMLKSYRDLRATYMYTCTKCIVWLHYSTAKQPSNKCMNVLNALTLSLTLMLAPLSSKMRMMSTWPLFEAL